MKLERAPKNSMAYAISHINHNYKYSDLRAAMADQDICPLATEKLIDEVLSCSNHWVCVSIYKPPCGTLKYRVPVTVQSGQFFALNTLHSWLISSFMSDPQAKMDTDVFYQTAWCKGVLWGNFYFTQSLKTFMVNVSSADITSEVLKTWTRQQTTEFHLNQSIHQPIHKYISG